MTRIFDLALFRSSDVVRIGASLAVALLVAGLVFVYSSRVVRIVPALGGFLVSSSIAERIFEIIHSEAGKFLVAGALVAGGILGVILFLRLLSFDDSLMILSAVWGAGMISLLQIDILDSVLISLPGASGKYLKGFQISQS